MDNRKKEVLSTYRNINKVSETIVLKSVTDDVPLLTRYELMPVMAWVPLVC